MSEAMVRKQIYIPKRQDALLKRIARQRGVSEAEVIRQALEREAGLPSPLQNGKDAFARMQAFSDDRKIKFAGKGEPLIWNREALYDERETRWFSPDKGA